jgi:transposase-like protein
VSKGRNKGGRRGKYLDWITDEGLIKIEGWARDGLTDDQIAQNIGIRRETLYDWKKKYPNFSNALKKGKEVVDRQVENALLKRALGYSYDEVTHERQYNKEKDEIELVPVKVVTKQVAPDTTAQIFWLKNRRPDKWRDRKELDANVNHSNNPFQELSVEELKKLADLDE